MQYRRLGRTELGVSLLSLGTGGASVLGQHKGLSQHDQDALVRRCLDLGINLFDTSADYMDSEAILGRALDGTPRDSYSLVTKWSHDDDGRRTKDPEELVGSVERSLRRLRTDHVDVMMFHGVLSSSYDDVVDRYYPVIQRLRDGGKLAFHGSEHPLQGRRRAPCRREGAFRASAALGHGHAEVRHPQSSELPGRRCRSPSSTMRASSTWRRSASSYRTPTCWMR